MSSSSSSSKQTFRVCFCFSRKFKLTVAEPPPEIKSLFNHYAATSSGIITADGLLNFIVEVQGETNATVENAEAVIDSFKHFKHPHHQIFSKNKVHGLTFDSFFRYLFQNQNAPLLQKVHQDMSAPLSHYFIFTGHNSYLTGNQISSPCSDVPIIKALLKGVRVIELDMWPNSAKDDIDILHGRNKSTSDLELWSGDPSRRSSDLSPFLREKLRFGSALKKESGDLLGSESALK